MSDGVSRAIEEIEGAVAKVVVGWKLTDFETIGTVEFDLMKITASIL